MHEKTSTAKEFHFPLPLIRFGEFDLGGVLYHANYFHLYESAREALFLAHGLSYRSYVEQNFHIALVETQQKFLQAVRYGDPHDLYLWTSDLQRTNAVFHYRIENAHKRPIHLASTKMVFVAPRGGKLSVRPFPAELREMFLCYERKA